MTLRTYEAIMNRGGALAVVQWLVQDSSWFELTPLPDDNYRLTVKDEDGPVQRVAGYAKQFPPNPEEEGL